MKKFLRLALLFVICFATDMTISAGRILTDSIKSGILGVWVKYNVYLPNNYGIKSDTKYPILYLLHGWSDDYTAWNVKGNMQFVADELMASGESRKMLIVMPNGGTADIINTWCGYFNMPGWEYADFFFKEFMLTVESKYHAIGDKGHRAVSGLSMGGGGSVVYCQMHPELFSSCFAMSAWLDTPVTEISKEKSMKIYELKKAVHEHSASNFVKNADEETKKKLRTVAWFLDCGDDDILSDVCEEFHMTMRRANIPIEFRVRNGIHNWEYWHYSLRMALPFISRNFDK